MTRLQFRLRVGDDIRVFYDVTDDTVQVLAIVPKWEAHEWLERHGESEQETEPSKKRNRVQLIRKLGKMEPGASLIGVREATYTSQVSKQLDSAPFSRQASRTRTQCNGTRTRTRKQRDAAIGFRP